MLSPRADPIGGKKPQPTSSPGTRGEAANVAYLLQGSTLYHYKNSSHQGQRPSCPLPAANAPVAPAADMPRKRKWAIFCGDGRKAAQKSAPAQYCGDNRGHAALSVATVASGVLESFIPGNRDAMNTMNAADNTAPASRNHLHLLRPSHRLPLAPPLHYSPSRPAGPVYRAHHGCQRRFRPRGSDVSESDLTPLGSPT